MPRIRKTARINGRQIEATGKTELEAVRKLAQKIAEIEHGQPVTADKMTVDQWFMEWFETYKKPMGLTAKSAGMYNEKYRNYIAPCIGRMKIKDVRESQLQKILNDEAGRSFSHLSKLRLVMREIFHRARIARIIQYDPAESLVLPASQKRQRRSLTDAERTAIIEVAKYHHAGPWVLTLLYTGMRPGESAALTWSAIDFKSNEIRIYAALESGSKRIKAPKTQAGNRTIPLPEELRPVLLLMRGKPFTPVFTTQAGNPLNGDSMRRMWMGFKRELDIYMGAKLYRNKIIESVVADDLVPYCLRHTYCTDMLAAGVPIQVVKTLMGHEDISTTANIYTHVNMQTLHNAARTLSLARKGMLGTVLENKENV